MARELTASDRKNLIRLASEMPAGSPKRKAILAGLKKTSAEYWAGSDKDRVNVALEANNGRTLWEGVASVADAKKMDDHLGKLHRMSEDRDLKLILSIDEEIKHLMDEKKRLVAEYGKSIAWAQSMKLWGHYEKGGTTSIIVTVQDADGDWHQIVDGDFERM